MQRPAAYSTRAVSAVLIAAFALIGVWMLLPGNWDPGRPASGGAADNPSLKVDGTVSVETDGAGVVVGLRVPLAVRGDDGLRLMEGGRMRAETYMSESASAAVPATYRLEWPNGDGDELLEPGERAMLVVGLPANTPVRADNPMNIVIRPADGPPLLIEDVLPR
jgi:hypothetical protein